MPPSKAIRERNAKIVSDYITGQYTHKDLAGKYEIPEETVKTMIRSAKKRLIDPVSLNNLQSNIQKKMEARITESLERQIKLGEAMIDKAQNSVDAVEVQTATELSTLAKSGVEIARKGYGIRDEDSKVTAIQINLSTPIQLGTEKIGETLSTQIDVNPLNTEPTILAEVVDDKH